MLRTVTEIQRPNSDETQVCVCVCVDETQQATRVCSLEFNIKYRQDFRTGASDTALRIQRQSCTATPRYGELVRDHRICNFSATPSGCFRRVRYFVREIYRERKWRIKILEICESFKSFSYFPDISVTLEKFVKSSR